MSSLTASILVRLALGFALLCAGSPLPAPASWGARLRGSAATGASSVDAQPAGVWQTLGDNMVADDEGVGLLTVHGDLDLCKQVCSHYSGCRSFAFCPGTCFLKDAEINASSPARPNEFCTTYFQGAPPVVTTSPPSQVQEPDDSEEVECYGFQVVLRVNEEQLYLDDPERNATGLARMRLCTNGTMWASLTVEGASTELIATHIHHCEGGDTPMTQTGVLCSGPPVVNFCGSNSQGLIDDGTPYAAPCAQVDSDGVSRDSDMRGFVVLGQSAGLTVAERVRDIAANTDQYYFNVHSEASFQHFRPKPTGMCRGPLRIEAAAPLASMTATTTPAAAAQCFSMFSQMLVNELQEWPNNPDSTMSGYADFLLCTNGTLRATALVFGGVTPVIAMHIHRCQNGSSPQTSMADLCQGPPVVNFCGDNSPGLLDDGVEYAESCAPWDGSGDSRTVGMIGAPVLGTTSPADVARLVEDIAAHPDLYFFNVHTLASWNHWYPQHLGACRGPMQM